MRIDNLAALRMAGWRGVYATILMTTAPVLSFAQETADQARPILLPEIVLNAETASESGDAMIAQTSRTGAKSATPLTRIPQAVSVVTRAQFEAQSADLVTEALRYTPGVLAESNGYDIRYDWYWIRGYDSFGYTWQDGLQLPGDPSSYAVPAIDPYALERIEVIKGPASVLYGQSVPGGLVNLVSKRPETSARREVFIEGSADGGGQLGGDVTGPLTRDGTLSYRLTGMAKNMGTQIDKERNRRLLIAPSLTWTPTDQTTLTGYGYFQKDEDSFSPRFYPAYGTLLPNPGGEIPRDLFLGDPSADDFNRDYAAIGYSLEHRFGDMWTVRQNLRYARSKQDMFLVLVNPAFAFPGAFPGVPGPELNRVSAVADDQLRNLVVDTQAEARFSTGAAHHTLLLGLDQGWTESSTNFGNSPPGVVPGLDITDPDYGIDVVPPEFSRSGLQHRLQTGIYVQDQVEMGSWIGTAALRYDWSRIRSTNRMTDDPAVTTRDQAVTGRVGVSYEFDNGMAPYVSYSTSFLPLLGTDAQGGPFEASTSKMAEIGLKYVPTDTNSLITASLFSMEQDGFLTPDPLDPFSDVQGGKQRVRGLELEAKVAVSAQLDVIASYAYSNSEILESTDALVVGNEMLRLPRHQGGLWMQYRDAGTTGLDLSLGLRGVSHYQTDAGYRSDLRIPGYGLVDMGVTYDLGSALPRAEGVTLQMTASNLFDRRFVAQCLNITGGSCNYGEGRSVKAKVSYAW